MPPGPQSMRVPLRLGWFDCELDFGRNQNGSKCLSRQADRAVFDFGQNQSGWKSLRVRPHAVEGPRPVEIGPAPPPAGSPPAPTRCVLQADARGLRLSSVRRRATDTRALLLFAPIVTGAAAGIEPH